MDPQAALDYARKAASDVLEDMDHERATDPDDVQRLAESFQALDTWLTRGGFLPPAWQPQAVENDGVTRCRDCEHPLHRRPEKALSGETQMVWADQHDVWVCDVTGNEHAPAREGEVGTHIVVEGNPVDGFVFHGIPTFTDASEASEWAGENCTAEWWVAPLQDVE